MSFLVGFGPSEGRDSGRDLARYLFSPRQRPVAVVCVAPDAPSRRIDARHIAKTVKDHGEVIQITTGKTSYELRNDAGW